MKIEFLHRLKSVFLITKKYRKPSNINMILGTTLNSPSSGKKKIKKQNKYS